MKNKKIIIIAIVSVILIGVGAFFLLQSTTTSDNKDIKEDRNYQTVTQVEDATISNTELSKESFEKEASEVGFEETTCENNGCIAKHTGYTNTEYEDVITLSTDENNGKTFSTMMYFHKSDFTEDNIYSQLNAVAKNYFGTEITKSQIKEVMTGLDNSTDDYYQKTYIVGTYTIEINMQNVVNTDFKLVKYLVLDTTLYNQYHGQ